MNRAYILILILLLFAFFVHSEESSSSINWASQGWVSTNFCQQGGNCNITNLTIINQNFYNVTGNITAPYVNAYIAWSYIYGFPPNCPAGHAVVGLGGSLSCSTFLITETDPVWNSEKMNYYNKTESDLNYCAIGSCGVSTANDLDIYGNISLQKNIDWNSSETGDNDLYPLPEKIILIGGEFT